MFQNQNLSITEQLNIGIRYLDLDLCVLPSGCNATAFGDLSTSRLVSCQGSATTTFGGFRYGGRLVDIFDQVDNWTNSNRREVIGLHFSILDKNGVEESSTVNGLVQLLEQYWGNQSSNSSVSMSTHYLTNSNTWPTLGAAVERNQRIFVFFDEDLNDTISSRLWINPAPNSTSFPLTSWDPVCSSLNNQVSRCSGTGNDLVIARGYTLALCIYNGQDQCNTILQNVIDRCYELRRRENRTVNIILVDYAESSPDRNTVFQVAAELNQRNVRDFLGPETPGTSATNGTSSMMDSTTTLYINSATHNSAALVSFCFVGLYMFSLFI